MSSDEDKEVKNFKQKLTTLNARKAKLSGSKHKRERLKVNKQISQVKKKIANLEKENEANVVKQEKKKKNQEEVAEERRLMREEQKAIVLKHAETVEKTTVEDLQQRIAVLQAGLEDYCTPSFWQQKIGEHDENVRQEKQKQKSFLGANNITPAMVKKLMDDFRAKGETFEQLKQKKMKAALEKAEKEQKLAEENNAEENNAEENNAEENNAEENNVEENNDEENNVEENVENTTEQDDSASTPIAEATEKITEEVTEEVTENETEEVVEKSTAEEENKGRNIEENKQTVPAELENNEPEEIQRPLQKGDSVIVETEEGKFPAIVQRYISKTKKWRVLKEDGIVLKVSVESLRLVSETQPFPGYKGEQVEKSKPVADVTKEEETTTKKSKKNYGSADYWDERYEKFSGQTEEWYEGWGSLKSVLEQHLSKSDIIMDFGCGDSFIQDELKKEGYSVWGTDISNAVLHRLSGKSEREMFSADGFCFPMKADSVDVIIDKGTLDAISCDEERNLAPLFQEIERILTPGGKYICLTPWHESKRMPQFNLVEWAEVQHEIIPLSLKTLARQRYNQLKDIPKFAANLNRLRQMSLVQAENELKEIDFEKAKDVHPQKNCVIHAYVCVKDIQFLN